MERYKVNIPEGTSGAWRVEHFEVSPENASFSRLRSIVTGVARSVPAGRYTRLTRNGYCIMSDTPAEIRDHRFAIHRARGRCLVAGLGLGMVVRAMLLKDEVEHVDVLELAPEVIELVGPHLLAEFGDRLTIHQADAYQWRPPKGVRWNYAWYDIWDDLCVDNLEQMTKLHRRFGRRVDRQDSWGKEFLRSQRARDRRNWY